MTEHIFHEVADWFHRSHHLPRYHHNQPQQEEPTMALPIITAIEDEARQLGAEVSDAWHRVLARHLTVGNMLAHAGQFVAGVEASPVAQAVEKFALGPAGEAAVARIVEEVAVLAEAQAQPAPAQ